MAKKSLKSFVVAISADTTKYDKGINDASSKMRGFRSTALKTGAGIGSMLLAVGANAVSTANKMDDLGTAMRFQDLGSQYVYNMGAAIKRLGGDSEEALSFITDFQDKFDQFKTLGEGSELYVQLKAAGLNAEDFVQASSVEDLLNRVSNSLVGASDKTLRMTQSALGVSTSFIALLQNGSSEFNNQLRISQDLHGSIGGLVDQSREFNNEWAIAMQKLDGFTNKLANETLPLLTNAVRNMGDLFSGKLMEDFKEEREARYGRKSTLEVIDDTLNPIYQSTPIPSAIEYIKRAIGYYDEDQGKTDSRILYEQSGVPVIGAPEKMEQLYDKKPSPIFIEQPSVPIIGAEAPKPTQFMGQPQASRIENIPATINLNATFEAKVDGEVLARSVQQIQEVRDLEFVEQMRSTTRA